MSNTRDLRPYVLPGLEPADFTSLTYGSGPGRVELRVPLVTPALLASAVDHLRRAREVHLARLPVARIVDAIDVVIQRWLDPTYPLRQAAEETLPAITGYSRPMLRRGLPELLRPFRREGLLALLESELGDSMALDAPSGGIPRAIGPRLTAHVLAGDLPVVAVESLVHALLVKSASLVKPSSRDPLFPALFAQSLAEADRGLAACVAVLWWKGGEASLERQAFEASDAVIAYGSDASVEAIRPLVPPTARFIPYGHRVSLAAIGREALRREGLEALAARAAWDVSFFDQRGCVSPHAIYVERGGQVAPLEFAEALAVEMQLFEERLPRGALSPGEAAAIQQLREMWEMRRAAGQQVRLRCSPNSTAWTVLYEEGAPFQPSCLNRVVRVVAVEDLSSLPALLEPMRRHLQTAGLAVSRERRQGLAAALVEVGITRLCPVGRMQHPPVTWRHDGRPNLLELLRWVDVAE